MRNTFIKIADSYGAVVRINVDHISAYSSLGDDTIIYMNGSDPIVTQLPPEEIDQMMIELYFTVKK